MGFFDRWLLAEDEDAGIFWIRRVSAGFTLRTASGLCQPVHEFLAERPARSG